MLSLCNEKRVKSPNIRGGVTSVGGPCRSLPLTMTLTVWWNEVFAFGIAQIDRVALLGLIVEDNLVPVSNRLVP